MLNQIDYIRNMENRLKDGACLDIDGEKILPGDNVLVIETYYNRLCKGKVSHYSEHRIIIELDDFNWKRMVSRDNTERMIKVMK